MIPNHHYGIFQAYEAKRIVRIEPWTSLNSNFAGLGYDPNKELEVRNQAAAHTDCLLNYKVIY